MSEENHPGADRGSATGPAAADDGKRRHRRVSAAGLEAELAESRSPPPMPRLALVNLSESGAAILSPVPLGETHQAFRIRVRPGAGGEPISYSCEICYLLGETRPESVEPRWLHGVQFRGIAAPALDFVRHWVVAHG